MLPGKKGEITTFLTVFALIVMLVGIFAGQRIKISESLPLARTPIYTGRTCFPNLPDSGCRGGTKCDPNTNTCVMPGGENPKSPESPISKCNNTCSSAIDCGGMGCSNHQCRNRLCIDDEDCFCDGSSNQPTPTPTPTDASTPTDTPTPTLPKKPCGADCARPGPDPACESGYCADLLKCSVEGYTTCIECDRPNSCRLEGYPTIPPSPMPTATTVPTATPTATTAPTRTPTPTLKGCGQPCNSNSECRTRQCIPSGTGYKLCTNPSFPSCRCQNEAGTEFYMCHGNSSYNPGEITCADGSKMRGYYPDACDTHYCTCRGYEQALPTDAPTEAPTPTSAVPTPTSSVPTPTSSAPTPTSLPPTRTVIGCHLPGCRTDVDCARGLYCDTTNIFPGICRRSCPGGEADNYRCVCDAGPIACDDPSGCVDGKDCETGYCDPNTHRCRSACAPTDPSCPRCLASTSAKVKLTNNSQKTITNVTIKLCRLENDCIVSQEKLSIPPGGEINLEKIFNNIVDKADYQAILVITYADGTQKEQSIGKKISAGTPINVAAKVYTNEIQIESRAILSKLDGNHDGVITALDFAVFLRSGQYGKCEDGLSFDINDSGCVNAIDISYFAPNLDKEIE